MSDRDMWQCFYPEYQEQRESTTFWMDFTTADAFGCEAIQDTFDRAFAEWKKNYKYLVELIAVCNHKIWQWYEIEGENSAKAILYEKLWRKADEWALNNLKDDELAFYFHVLD